MTILASLGLRSDLLVLRGVAEVAEYPDCIVVRTPSEPDFWCGNMMIFRGRKVDPGPQLARFVAAFPRARHAALSWDTVEMPDGTELAGLERLGFEIDRLDVLTLTGTPRPIPSPAGIDIRPVETPADWAQVIALQVETGLEQGYAAETYGPFVRDRFASHRRQVAAGRARWFGAFDGALLTGDLGIYVGDGTARFQAVETRRSHRGRGICAALVGAGLDWAARQDPTAVPVIVAEAEGAAGRVYRRCGFALAERQVLAIRPPAEGDGGPSKPA